MIKAKMTNDITCKVEVTGQVKTIVSEMMYIVCAVFKQMPDNETALRKAIEVAIQESKK